MSSNASNATNNEVFVYTGEGGAAVPRDVVRVRVNPTVTSIPSHAFANRTITEVELCEGLVEIGDGSFGWCGNSITKINIPISLRWINNCAFWNSLRCPIRLHDGIESIGEGAFAYCIFTNFRVPPLITEIPQYMIDGCKSMFSLELPKDVTEIGNEALTSCYCLRNVAFPPNADVGYNIFIEEGMEMTDLQQLFGSEAQIITALQLRFNGLPIHSIVYYHSYQEGVLQILIAAINMRLGLHRTSGNELDLTGNQQDCLGMTPLHILTCSSIHDLELYRVIVEKYPANLITEDRWGALPLLYAFWGAAPTVIIQFLLESYRSLYPDHVFNWTLMVETMGRCDTPTESIENLLRVRQMHFPEQPLDWVYLLNKFAEPSSRIYEAPFQERMRFLFTRGMSSRVKALPFEVWRDHIMNVIQTAEFKQRKSGNSDILHRIQANIIHFEDELPKLKEITTILELALWKLRMNENGHQDMATHDSNVRRQCRTTCGADVVIFHVLPYLTAVVDEESDSYVESDSDSTSDDESSDTM